jgi:hypothetical protein
MLNDYELMKKIMEDFIAKRRSNLKDDSNNKEANATPSEELHPLAIFAEELIPAQ